MQFNPTVEKREVLLFQNAFTQSSSPEIVEERSWFGKTVVRFNGTTAVGDKVKILEEECLKLKTKLETNCWEEDDFRLYTNLKVWSRQHPEISEVFETLVRSKSEVEERAKAIIEKYDFLKRDFNQKLIKGILDYYHKEIHTKEPLPSSEIDSLYAVSYLDPEIKGRLKQCMEDWKQRRENIFVTLKCLDRLAKVFRSPIFSELESNLSAEKEWLQQYYQTFCHEDFFYLELHFTVAERILGGVKNGKTDDFDDIPEFREGLLSVEMEYIFKDFMIKSGKEIKLSIMAFEALEYRINELYIQLMKVSILENCTFHLPGEDYVTKVISKACVPENRKCMLKDLFLKLKLSFDLYEVGLLLNKLVTGMRLSFSTFYYDKRSAVACLKSVNEIDKLLQVTQSQASGIIESHHVMHFRTYRYYTEFFKILYKIIHDSNLQIKEQIWDLEICGAIRSNINNPLKQKFVDILDLLKR